MKLNELAVASPAKQAAKVFESYFGNAVKFDQLTSGQSRTMLKRVRSLIAEHRRTSSFHQSEKNPAYLKMVMLEQALGAVAAPGTATPAQGGTAQPGAEQAAMAAGVVA